VEVVRDERLRDLQRRVLETNATDPRPVCELAKAYQRAGMFPVLTTPTMKLRKIPPVGRYWVSIDSTWREERPTTERQEVVCFGATCVLVQDAKCDCPSITTAANIFSSLTRFICPSCNGTGQRIKVGDEIAFMFAEGTRGVEARLAQFSEACAGPNWEGKDTRAARGAILSIIGTEVIT
jgi:hypothetical protein